MIPYEHRRAEELFSQAELLARERRELESRRLFAEAAGFERLAFQGTPSEKPRARGILAVSFVALLVKARELSMAKREASRLLGDKSLPESAHRRLAAILLDLPSDDSRSERGEKSEETLAGSPSGRATEPDSYRRAGLLRDSGPVAPSPSDIEGSTEGTDEADPPRRKPR